MASRLQEYLITEYQKNEKSSSRVKSISTSEANKLVSSKCSNAVKAYKSGGSFNRVGNFISRIASTARKVDYGFLDASTLKPRMSSNTLNYYTLIINDDKLWQPKWPKRQIIGTAGAFSNRQDPETWIIFPFNGVSIGVCSEQDMWDSFKALRGNSASGFNEYIYSILSVYKFKSTFVPSGKQSYDKSLEEFKVACNDFDEWVRKTLEEEGAKFGDPAYEELIGMVEYKAGSSVLDMDWFMSEYYPKSNYNLYKAVLKIYNPSGFKLIKAGGSLPSKQRNEVWFDGPALFVNTTKIDELMGE